MLAAVFTNCFVTYLLAAAADQQTMTYVEAKKRINNQGVPPWWVTDIPGVLDQLAKVSKGTVSSIARSPGGHEVHLVQYGGQEQREQLANFNSAVGAREPDVYRTKSSRKKPVIYFLGPVHGQEIEGVAGLVNFIHVLETGRDLRERPQPTLVELAQKCRLLIIPVANPDGVARCEPRSFVGLSFLEMRFWGQGTWSDDSIIGWPAAKRLHPMIGERVGFRGCYFNDDGINLMHDEFFAPLSKEVPAILQVAYNEAPDLAVSLHSHNDLPMLIRPAHVPLEVQQDVLALAKSCYALLDQRKLPHVGPFTVQAEQGVIPRSFNLVSAIHHTCGAASFTFESPHGLEDETWADKTHERILDIQLSLYEAMMRFEIDKKVIP